MADRDSKSDVSDVYSCSLYAHAGMEVIPKTRHSRHYPLSERIWGKSHALTIQNCTERKPIMRMPRAQRCEPAPITEVIDGGRGIRVQCPHCDRDHFHSPSTGHRAAHCALGQAMDGYIVTDPQALLSAATA